MKKERSESVRSGHDVVSRRGSFEILDHLLFFSHPFTFHSPKKKGREGGGARRRGRPGPLYLLSGKEKGKGKREEKKRSKEGPTRRTLLLARASNASRAGEKGGGRGGEKHS